MTFLVGQAVKCISPGPSGKITEGQLYIVMGTRVDEDGDSFVFVNGVSREFFASRFEAVGLSTSPDVPPDMPIPKPKAPAIVLNAEAKGKAKVIKTQWITTNPTALPEGSVDFTKDEYIVNPSLIVLSPVWITIKSRIPQKHRDYVYEALKIAFSSLDTMSLRPRATRIVDVFTWSSTPQKEMWHHLSDALDTGNWSKFNDYVESSSTA
jgi:hypothetical protein